MKYFILIGVLLGAVAGFGYWYYIGCYSGVCPITSNWPVSSTYGAVMGGLLGSISGDFIKGKKSEEAENPVAEK